MSKTVKPNHLLVKFSLHPAALREFRGFLVRYARPLIPLQKLLKACFFQRASCTSRPGRGPSFYPAPKERLTQQICHTAGPPIRRGEAASAMAKGTQRSQFITVKPLTASLEGGLTDYWLIKVIKWLKVVSSVNCQLSMHTAPQNLKWKGIQMLKIKHQLFMVESINNVQYS